MKSRLRLIGYYTVFWIVFFELSRVLFLVYHGRLSIDLGFEEVVLILVHGLRMDLSATGYLLLLPCFLLMLTPKWIHRFLYDFLKYYTAMLLLVFTFIVVADLELYRHWGFRLDDTPLLYLKNPKEVVGSSSPWRTLGLLGFWLVFFTASFRIFMLKVLPHGKLNTPGNLKMSIFFYLLILSLILPIRGSLGPSNMNAGFVYFHQSNVFANHAAINVVWNFKYYLLKSDKAHYPEDLLNRAKTDLHFEQFYADEGQSKPVLNTTRPNIILIALESYTSKIVGVLGGVKGVTPVFDSLAKEGILFNNIYSSGDRTEDGLVSILSGYPAQPRTSIMKYPKKTQSLPFISRELKQLGYHTSFVFGYDLDYANFRSYLVNADFASVKSKENFKLKERYSKWGVHDHIVLNEILEELEDQPTPFFMCSMTLSSHEPFDVPMEPVFTGGETEQFFNSAFYTDKSIGEFIQKAKSMQWWKNTLVILVADHGSRLPNNDPHYASGKFTIPMLWLGGALAVRDTVINSLGSQTDIGKTLLTQLNADEGHFEYSKDLLSGTSKPFAYYSFTNGFGFIGRDYQLVYDHDANNFITQKGLYQESDKEQSLAYVQKLFLDFNNR